MMLPRAPITDATLYHSPMPAATSEFMHLPIQMGPNVLELEAQQRWMMHQQTNPNPYQQTGSSNHYPSTISAGIFPQEHSNSRGIRSSGIASSGGPFSLSMLGRESTSEQEFGSLMCHYSGMPNARVKGELYPSLFAKVNAIVSDETTSRTLLHMLLDNSDIPEMLCLHCFPQLLQQRIDEVYLRRTFSPSIGGGARVSAFPTDPLARGSARESASAHASVRTSSSYTDGIRISSESGSGIQTPSPEIEAIIKALLSNKWEQAAHGFQNIYHGGGLGTTTPRSGITKEATSTEMLLSSVLERTTALLASKALEHDGRGSNAEKVKFSTFKDAGHSAGQTSIESILWTWETEFASAGLPPNVSRVIGLMLPGGNLSNWKDTFRSVTRDLHDPEDIRNWTWERFGKELYKSPMYRAPDKKKLLDALKKVACKDPGHSDQITTYDNAFTLALQNLRLYHLDSTFSPAQQAQMYYDNLPPLIRKHMALRDGKRADPEIRDNLDEVRAEARAVSHWSVFQAEAASLNGGRAMGALGASGTGTVGPPSAKRVLIEPRDGEVVRFAERPTATSKAWLDQNAAKYNCRHGRGQNVHVIVGPEHQIKAIFNNRDARAAGLIQQNRKRSEDSNAQGRDAVKPSNVSAQAVQATITSPRDQGTSQLPPSAAASVLDQPSSDANVSKSGGPKVYSYSADIMPGSHAFSGRARGLTINFGTASAPGIGSALLQQGTTDSCVNSYFVPESGSTLITDADVFFDACECLPSSPVHAPPDMDLFFDTSEFFDDDAVIVECAGVSPDPHPGARAQARSFIAKSSPRLSFATRAARGAKVALATLKCIATYELTGVLQPFIVHFKRSYVPKRQLQALIMLFFFVGMICVTVGVTSVSHRAHLEATSVMSILVKPVLVSVAMSNIVNLAGYQFFMTVLQRVLFPISPLRYSHQNPRTATKDPYYSRKSDALFQNISMMGLKYGVNQEREAALVCLHLNFETKHSKVGMLDSGCNNAMQVLTDDVRACVVDFDTNGRITGDQVHGEFTTDASGTLGITLNAISDTGSVFDFDFIVEKMQLVRNLSYNLFPSSFFTRRGCDVFFHGRKSLTDPNPAGTGEIRLHEIKSDSRQFVGKVDLKSWNDLWFFNYRIFNPAQDVAMIATACAYSKLSNTIKAHVTYGHASGRRVHGAFKHDNRGDDIFSDLPCSCPICAVTKSETPGHRKFERHFQHADIDVTKVQGDYLIAHDPRMQEAIHTLRDMDFCSLPPAHTVPANFPVPRKGIVAAMRRSTAPRQYWHADTIPLASNWQKAKHALILVDDFTRQCFVKLLKDKTQIHVAEALNDHFTQQRPFSTGVKGVNFYVRNTVLRSDRGSEFINVSVLDVCSRHGCIPEYSCPGQLGKYQNGVVERKIKEIGRMARAMMYTAEVPDLASAYCLLQAVDILNMLPSTANPADPASNVTGFSPYLLYYNSAPPLEQIYAFGSFCTVHLDADHLDPLRPNVRAASCIYLCRAHHCHSQGHIVWEYRDHGKGRKLIVPEISSHIWNYFPMRTGPEKHLSNSLTFVAPDLASHSAELRPPSDVCPKLYIDNTTDPMCPHFPDSQVIIAAPSDASLSFPPLPQQPSKYKTRQFDRMSKNIGAKVRRTFFINGTSGPVDFYEGIVRSITPSNKYDIMYDDNDSEEMSEREFAYYSMPPKAQAHAHIARLGGDYCAKECTSCNCAEGHCYHPWSNDTPHFNPSDTMTNISKSGIRKLDTSEGKYIFPSKLPPIIPEYYAACHFPEAMPNVVETDNPIQGMLSHAAMMSSRKKAQKLSAYEADPITVEDCIRSKNWETPINGNSWKDAILNEIGNLMKFKVFEVIGWQDVPTGERVWQIVVNFLTKRTKDSTPERECIDKRKCRVCFGGHHMTAGVHFERTEAYAPVPSWTTIKLQLALTAKHRLGLRAFDCTAAYLQAELKKPLYARPPKGLMSVLQKEMEGENVGTSANDVWKLRKALYGYAGSSRLWWDKVSSWLKSYGFRALGNSGTFMMLDNRNATEESMQGIILLNLYSDDGLASIDNSALWDKFMLDFKKVFDVVEKDPDYFLGCAIEWDQETGVIKLDASKYLREVISKFDMVGAHPSPIPAPAGMKIYANESWDGDEKFRNLYQQYCGCINYAALIRPELSYYASQICRVMSMPTEENLRVAQNILKYAIGSIDEKITYRPTDANDPFGGYNYGLMVFTDSDWATSVDTRRSHGCYIVMLAGGCIAHRSKAHKSVMLSSAAAEYYEASEGCRELIYIRGILEDFYGEQLPPTPMYIDNAACIAMGKMPVFSERQKHIPIRVCHLKECCDEGIVELRHIGTKYQLADIGTKALPAPAFIPLRDVILGKVSFSDLQGM